MTADEMQGFVDGALTGLISTTGGQLLIARLLHMANVWYPSFDADSAHTTSYMEGRRAVGLELIDMLHQADGDALAKVLQTSSRLLIDVEASGDG